MTEKPGRVLVYGDTNSTLAGALVAAKLRIPLAHVEAGLRSYNKAMPEEHNRVLTDHCADILLCPTASSVERLRKEGIVKGVHNVGDVMFDVLTASLRTAEIQSRILEELNAEPKEYILTTIHRPHNTDDPERLRRIANALSDLATPVIFPLHPRTQHAMRQGNICFRSDHIKVTGPVGYFDMLVLEQHAQMIITDSGGVQKEAYILGAPCITLRTETEWFETVEAGWNRLLDIDHEDLSIALESFNVPTGERPQLFGDGDAATRIVKLIS